MAPTETVPHTRADAQRNRSRLLAAARELVAAEGVDVSVREIARAAGVGIATLYRHFPTRDELIDAVLEDAFVDFLQAAEAAADADDAWTGLTGLIEAALISHARNRGLRDVVETRAHGRERAATMRRRFWTLVTGLVERAHDQGTLRADFAPQDVALIFWGSDRVLELAGDVAPDVWRRHLALVFDGLRSPAATPLVHPPLSEGQLERVGSRRACAAPRRGPSAEGA
jgi:AcrR family transcriptional regulator